MAKQKPGKVGENKSEIVREIPAACADEGAAVEFMEKRRWGDMPCCPHCGSIGVYAMQSRDGGREKHYRWRCKDCGKQFSVRTGTVFEDSRIPLRHWCYAFWAACSSKKGVSAKQIQRQTGLSYKSALFLMHRIRFAMTDDPRTPPKLTGTVEADETYVGGKPRYKGPHNKRGRGTKKTPAMAVVQRGGAVRAQVVQSVTAENLKRVIRENVDRNARMMTDENTAYIGLHREFPSHETTLHSAREYVRGDVHSNTAEAFFAILKRGMYGTYHAVSKEHLHRYVNEFAFRWNHRKSDDGARTLAAIQGSIGKRLMYREPVDDKRASQADA